MTATKKANVEYLKIWHPRHFFLLFLKWEYGLEGPSFCDKQALQRAPIGNIKLQLDQDSNGHKNSKKMKNQSV
jgi:hypothetical protein